MGLKANSYRGSRKHILDWTNQYNFLKEFEELLFPLRINLNENLIYAPKGYNKPKEVRLKHWKNSQFYSKYCELDSWWLAHSKGANTPNWDLSIECFFQNSPTLILVEAKAHINELSQSGKVLKATASKKSIENHKKISSAIHGANNALSKTFPELNISINSHYQLSNRIAFSWKLANMGFKVILVYLGFTDDKGISDVGKPIEHQQHWQYIMETYTSNILPDSFWNKCIACGKGSMYATIKSRTIIEPSKPRGA